MTAREPPTRLSRELGVADAVVVGLGAMVGAGVFSAIGPAARAAGGALLVGLAVASLVALCNATSSAQLAAVYPRAGGTYVYGTERLGPVWGFAAGWGFVVGKTASCAAMALTFGAHVWPDQPRAPAMAAVVVLALVNLGGVTKTTAATRAILAIVLAALAIVVIACLFGGTAQVDNIGPVRDAGAFDVLQSAGLLFFAFAGYARIATLGEEVRDPARTIPRAVPIALGLTLVIYAVVALAALLAAGPETLASANAPLAAAVEAGDLDALSPVVRVGGAVASLGVLLSLMLGVSRTAFAMADERDLPRWLAAVHPRTRVPHRAELALAAVVVVVVALVDVRGAIGFSSFAVLLYYAIANASAFTLPDEHRTWPRALTVLGVVGCLALAITLPLGSAVSGAAVMAVGLLLFLARAVLVRDRAPGAT